MVIHALKMLGEESFCTKDSKLQNHGLSKCNRPNCEKPVVGIRPGEKIHEEMITPSDSYNTYDLGKYYTILPSVPVWDIKEFIKEFQAKKVQEGFSYNSGQNTDWALFIKRINY